MYIWTYVYMYIYIYIYIYIWILCISYFNQLNNSFVFLGKDIQGWPWLEIVYYEAGFKQNQWEEHVSNVKPSVNIQ